MANLGNIQFSSKTLDRKKELMKLASNIKSKLYKQLLLIYNEDNHHLVTLMLSDNYVNIFAGITEHDPDDDYLELLLTTKDDLSGLEVVDIY